MKPQTRKAAYIGGALILVVLLGLGAKRMKSTSQTPKPLPETLQSRGIRGTGTLESVQEVPLAFKVGGRILDLPLDEGSPIHQGQVLGSLDPRDLREQLSASQAARGVAQSGMSKALADLTQAKATLQRAQSDHARLQKLFQGGILSRADLDQTQERLNVAQAALQSMEAVQLQAQRQEELTGSTESLQRLNLEEGQLRSPVDGILTRRLKEPGHIISAGTPVLTVISTRKLWIRTWVDESALGRLKIGQAAKVELRSHPGQSFRARVDRIGRQSDRQTHELLVDVELLERPPLFAVGQRADVEILEPEVL